MMHAKKTLTGIKGLSEAKVDKICEAVEKIVNFGYITGSDALLKRKSVVRIATGSTALDELLGGGIETLSITEAFGEFRSVLLAHTLCVSTQLPINMRGGNGKVAYVDIEGTFRPDRIIPIAERFGMDPGAVLDNIIYARAYTYEHQYNLLLGLAAKMAEEPFRLLIVDSVIAPSRVDFTGRGEPADRPQKLAHILSRLIENAEEFNVAVYITNQVIADPGGGIFISDPKKPAATIRLMFSKGKGSERVCKVFNASNLSFGILPIGFFYRPFFRDAHFVLPWKYGDWCILPVRDQGNTDMCYGFVLVECIHTFDCNIRRSGEIETCSTQQIMDHYRESRDIKDREGSTFQGVVRYAVEVGLCREIDYPWTGDDSRIVHPFFGMMTKRTIKGSSVILLHSEVRARIEDGHTVCARVSMTDSMRHCMSECPMDICEHTKEDSELILLNCVDGHFMSCIGHGARIKDGVKYWLLKNSYGIDDGYYGFCKIFVDHVDEFHVIDS